MQLAILLLVATSTLGTLSHASGNTHKLELKMAKSRKLLRLDKGKQVVVKLNENSSKFILCDSKTEKIYTFTEDTTIEVTNDYVCIRQLETKVRSSWLNLPFGHWYSVIGSTCLKADDGELTPLKYAKLCFASSKGERENDFETFTELLKSVKRVVRRKISSSSGKKLKQTRGDAPPPPGFAKNGRWVNGKWKFVPPPPGTKGGRWVNGTWKAGPPALPNDFAKNVSGKRQDGPPPLPEDIAKKFSGKHQVGMAPTLPRSSDAKRGHDNEETKTNGPSVEQGRRNRIFCGKKRPKLAFLSQIGDNRTKVKPASKKKPEQRMSTQKWRRRKPNTNLLAEIGGFNRAGMRKITSAPRPVRPAASERSELHRKIMAKGRLMRQASADESSDSESYNSDDD